jgi:hypothetical protein
MAEIASELVKGAVDLFSPLLTRLEAIELKSVLRQEVSKTTTNPHAKTKNLNLFIKATIS